MSQGCNNKSGNISLILKELDLLLTQVNAMNEKTVYEEEEHEREDA